VTAVALERRGGSLAQLKAGNTFAVDGTVGRLTARREPGGFVSEREARLKPEYAAEYPGMEPDRWLPAGELAKRLVERTHARRKSRLYTRTFDPTHFEFRGGDPGSRPRVSRTRDTDTPA
jgi:hypothetical protein